MRSVRPPLAFSSLALRVTLGAAVAAAAMLPLLTPAPAKAQGTGTGGSSGTSQAVSKADFFMRLLRPDGEDKWTIFTEFEQKYYFNRARCSCSDEVVRLELDLSTTGAAKRTMFATNQTVIQVLIGEVACVSSDPAALKAAICSDPPLATLTLADLARARQRTTIDIPVSAFYGPSGGECTRRGQQFIRLRVDTNGDGVPDLTGEAAPVLSVEYDGEAPPPPATAGIKVRPGNEALEVSWERDQGVADFRGYVVFCSRGEAPVYAESSYDDQYRTAETECPSSATVQPLRRADGPQLPPLAQAQQADDGAGEVNGTREAEGPFTAPTPFATLDTRFVCSELLVSQDSTRLTGLQNEIPYLVGVATIDLHGNASPIESVLLQRPFATRDFFRGYREADGQAVGGYCAMARPGSRGGVAGLAGFALGVWLLRQGLRRRRS